MSNGFPTGSGGWTQMFSGQMDPYEDGMNGGNASNPYASGGNASNPYANGGNQNSRFANGVGFSHTTFRPAMGTTMGPAMVPTMGFPQQQQLSPERMSATLDAGQINNGYFQSASPEELHGIDQTSPTNVNNGQQLPLSQPVPISRLSSTAQPEPVLGPMSTNYEIPSRPKPGRKPLPQEAAADRRRLQNRMAQRNFRDKRQQKLVETQNELRERKQEFKDEMNQMTIEMQRMKEGWQAEKQSYVSQVERLKIRAAQAEEKAREMESKLKQLQQQMNGMHGNGFGNGFQNVGNHGTPNLTIDTQTANIGHFNGRSTEPTPPDSDNMHGGYPFEQNFTTYGQQSTGTVERCGFCTDDSNCTCRQREEETAKVLESMRRPSDH